MHAHAQATSPSKSLISTFGRVTTNEISSRARLGKLLCPWNVEVVGPQADLGIPPWMLICFALTALPSPAACSISSGDKSLVFLQARGDHVQYCTQ